MGSYQGASSLRDPVMVLHLTSRPGWALDHWSSIRIIVSNHIYTGEGSMTQIRAQPGAYDWNVIPGVPPQGCMYATRPPTPQPVHHLPCSCCCFTWYASMMSFSLNSNLPSFNVPRYHAPCNDNRIQQNKQHWVQLFTVSLSVVNYMGLRFRIQSTSPRLKSSKSVEMFTQKY